MGFFYVILNIRLRILKKIQLGGMILLRRTSDKNKAMVWQVLLLVLAVVGFIGVGYVKNAILAECEKTLYSVTNVKANAIGNYFEQQSKSMRSAADEYEKTEPGSGRIVASKLSMLPGDADFFGIYNPEKYDEILFADGKSRNIDITEAWEKVKAGKSFAKRLSYAGGDAAEEYVFLAIPWKQDVNTSGMLYSGFALDKYAKIISTPVYKESEYTYLASSDGKIDGCAFGGEEIYSPKMTDEIEKQFSEIITGTDGDSCKFRSNNDKFIAVACRITGFPDISIVTAVNTNVVYADVSKVITAIYVTLCVILSVAVIQTIVSVVSYNRRRKEIADIVNTDELTGLPTKSYHKKLVSDILENKKNQYAYVSCDISEFKFINSTYGYEYGNMALKHIAGIFDQCLQNDETACRTGEDHFSLLLQYEGTDQFIERFNEILDKCSDLPKDDNGKGGKAVFTCGVYIVNPGDDVNRIRARANVARRSLKKSIANQIAFYSEEDFNKNLRNHELEAELLQVIEKKELHVFFQPKYEITNEKVIGAEALVRWQHPTKGVLSPNQFIPLAEENGFVKEIDFFVFESVCKMQKSWIDAGKRLVPISINFSRVHLDDEDFVDHILQIANKYKVDPKMLEIELTETAVFGEMQKLLNVMYKIKNAGFGLSMDDFGSGYSSLNLLREMPVDVLKLDKEFLDDCGEGETREKKVISHVISMAKDLEISVLAEGVETQSQKDFLQEANCDMIQGYYYAKPMPKEEFESYL